MMTPSFICALIAIAMATGILTGLTGASGMSILISGLLLAGVDIREIIALTFVVTLANGIASSIPYYRRGLVDRRLVSTVGLAAAAAVYPGFWLSHFVPESILKWVILTGLFVAGLKLLWKPATQPQAGEQATQYSVLKEIAAGLAFGIVMGILGGGGGIFIAVVLILFFKTNAKPAIGTSIVIMALAAIPGCLLHASQANINWSIAGVVIPVSFVVAFLAARVGRKIPEAYVKRGVGLYLIAIFLIMLVKVIL